MLSKHADDLAGKIQQLQADRQHHVEAMAAIDRVLDQIGQALRAGPADSARAAADPAPATPVLRELPTDEPRRRGRFQVTGLDSVLNFIRRQVDPSTAEINAHWRNEGRKGTANVTLLKLLKDGLIRRESDPSVRGSRYRLADQGDAARATRLNAANSRN